MKKSEIEIGVIVAIIGNIDNRLKENRNVDSKFLNL